MSRRKRGRNRNRRRRVTVEAKTETKQVEESLSEVVAPGEGEMSESEAGELLSEVMNAQSEGAPDVSEDEVVDETGRGSVEARVEAVVDDESAQSETVVEEVVASEASEEAGSVEEEAEQEAVGEQSEGTESVTDLEPVFADGHVETERAEDEVEQFAVEGQDEAEQAETDAEQVISGERSESEHSGEDSEPVDALEPVEPEQVEGEEVVRVEGTSAPDVVGAPSGSDAVVPAGPSAPLRADVDTGGVSSHKPRPAHLGTDVADRKPGRFGLGHMVAACAVAAALGAGICYAVTSSTVASGMEPVGSVRVASSGLDEVLARYVLDGTWHDVTAREVIESTSSVDAASSDDGVEIPTAEEVLDYCRNRIIEAEAASRGIEVTDDALAEYAESMLGTSDFSMIADSYGMDEAGARSAVSASLLNKLLRDDVVGEEKSSDMPDLPEEPKVDGADKMSADELEAARAKEAAKPRKAYADYIIKLVGDEWDAKRGTWASEDGSFAKALADFEVTPEGATYEAALAAYYNSYQAWADAQSGQESQWSDFVNGLLSKSCVEVRTLAMP